MSLRSLEEIKADGKKVSDSLDNLTNIILLDPYCMFMVAKKGKVSATQIKELRKEITFYCDPEIISKDVEISDIETFVPDLWEEILAQLEQITKLFYSVIVLKKYADKYAKSPEMAVQNIIKLEEEMNTLQVKLLEQLQTEYEQIESKKTKYLLVRLARRLFAPWVQSEEARQVMANWPSVKAEREALYESMFREGSPWQKSVGEKFVKHFAVNEEHAKRLAKLPVFSADSLRKIVQDLENLVRGED